MWWDPPGLCLGEVKKAGKILPSMLWGCSRERPVVQTLARCGAALGTRTEKAASLCRAAQLKTRTARARLLNLKPRGNYSECTNPPQNPQLCSGN